MYNFIEDYLGQLDEKAFLAINQAHHTLCDQIAACITHELFWIPFYIVLGYLIFKNLGSSAWLALGTIALLITLCDQFASSLVKPWIQRLRPCFDPTLQSIAHIVGNYHGLYGFISSHAANTFGLATFVWLLLKPYYSYMGILFVWAGIVSYARIYGGVHYPADVIVGALSGVLWGWVMFRIYKMILYYVKLKSISANN